MKKRVIFMGTPAFAVEILSTLSTLDCDLIAVVSQPDRKVGRKQVITQTPVKAKALTLDIPVYQPEKIGELTETLIDLRPDLIVTCAYGQFIPTRILEIPTYGCVNVHASLLPKYRGGAPIHTAILNGEKESGVTLMRMVKKMDAGAILFQASCPIYENDDMGRLHDRLAKLGSELLNSHWSDLFAPGLEEIPQDESLVTFAYNITPEQEFVSMNRPTQVIHDHIRALHPWPLAYGRIDGKTVKLLKATKSYIHSDALPGTVLGLIEAKLAIKTLDGMILVEELQLEGKTRLDAKTFYLGIGKTWLNRRFEETL